MLPRVRYSFPGLPFVVAYAKTVNCYRRWTARICRRVPKI